MDRAIWTWRSMRRSWHQQVGAWWRRRTAWHRFWNSYRNFCRIAPDHQQPQLADLYPCTGDDGTDTPIEPTYFYQDTWAFERILQRKPSRHVDVGSHHKFVAFLSKVTRVTMVDIRPLSLPLDSIDFRLGSITALPFDDGSVESLSSLCVVEHIGLGRYGDPLDPEGSEKAIAELIRVLAPGGRLYLSVPLADRNVIAFNAGRMFCQDYLMELLSPLTVTDQMFIVGNSYQPKYENRARFGTTGLFELVKPANATGTG